MNFRFDFFLLFGFFLDFANTRKAPFARVCRPVHVPGGGGGTGGVGGGESCVTSIHDHFWKAIGGRNV